MDPFYLAVLLYVAAVVLALVDLFVPSGGMLIVLALLSATGSVLFGFRAGTIMGMTMLTLVIASVPTFAIVAINIWPHTPIGRRIILALPKPDLDPQSAETNPMQALLGKVLVAEHSLLPTGHLRVGHRKFNATAENGIVETGQHVKVVAIRDRNLVVRVTDEPVTTHFDGFPFGERPDAANENDKDSAQKQRDLLELSADELGLESIDE